mmetsp:Transcript_19048/g.44784  ORF Transcript_19048/g.44784 Transcript_19048/m.44784 type:complete len:209 (-) Transcript_19048:129-755(-)
MSKYSRFFSGEQHGGYSAKATVAQSDKLNTLLPDFKRWFASINGFGDYLRTFFTHYQNYFDAYAEEHALIYTQVHKEFSANLEQSIDQWLHAKGLSEQDFGEMLQLAQERGDAKSDEIVAVLLGMLDYQLWIRSIFDLKRSGQVADLLEGQVPGQPQALTLSVAVPEGVSAGQELQVTSPDGQLLQVAVPPGLCSGQVFSVSYLPLAT